MFTFLLHLSISWPNGFAGLCNADLARKLLLEIHISVWASQHDTSLCRDKSSSGLSSPNPNFPNFWSKSGVKRIRLTGYLVQGLMSGDPWVVGMTQACAVTGHWHSHCTKNTELCYTHVLQPTSAHLVKQRQKESGKRVVTFSM